MNFWNGIIGLLGSGIIATVAYRKRSLTGSGALAAIVVGTLFYLFGGLAWFGTLIAFFVSSTLLTKWKKKKKAALESSYEKTGNRDALQVFANGGLAVLICVLNHWLPSALWWYGFLGVMATVNADTWATEIGGLSHTSPRSILNGRKIPPGTSGGVTPLGLFASLCGAGFVGLIAWLLTLPSAAHVPFGPTFLAALAAGTLGALADSLLGASLQVMYRCQVCGKVVERTVHCDRPTQKVRGLNGFNNDLVNVTSSVVGGLLAILLFY